MSATEDLIAALGALRTRLDAVRLPLPAAGADEARAERDALCAQLDDYLLPRLCAQDAPVLVVVGGSTGAGKSTLVNSLLHAYVTAPGVLRPTTRAPVLVHHPLDADWFADDRVLPGFVRIRGSSEKAPAGRSLQLIDSPMVPRGLALLDAPDIDSVVTQNRELAAQLLAAADQWLFVTTAARYADAVPWDLLREAAARRAEPAVVLDRVDPGAEPVVDDLRRMLHEHGLAAAPVFVLPERTLTGGLLPEADVAPIAAWLTHLATDPGARARAVEATWDGAVGAVVAGTRRLGEAADEQRAAGDALRAVVTRAYDDAHDQVRAATSDGTLLRGEVLARWQDFVGTGDFFRALENRVGRARDRVSGWLRGRRVQAPAVAEAISTSLERVVLDAAQEAARRAFRGWYADPAGAIVREHPELAAPAADLADRIGAQIRAWQGDVLALVGEQSASKRGTARALSFGVNGLGIALMVVVFAATGGLTGAEVGIAGGTAVLAQRLLEAVFGDDAVRRLSCIAHERLDARVGALLQGEAERYTRLIDVDDVDEPSGQELREAADRVAAAAGVERAARPLRPAPALVPADASGASARKPRRWWRRLRGAPGQR
ncbi:MAG: ABC transporter [Cellulomonadaceae bacterium]